MLSVASLQPQPQAPPGHGGSSRGGSDAGGGAFRLALVPSAAEGPFATLEDVMRQGHTCAFCQLLWRAVSWYRGGGSRRQSIAGPPAAARTQLFVAWEVDGRERKGGGQLVNRSRRIRVSWKEGTENGSGGPGVTAATGRRDCVYLVLMAQQRAAPNASAHNRFLGRAWPTQESKQELMRGWIDTCAGRHGGGCSEWHGSGPEFMQLLEGTYFGVIDTLDMQLKPLPIVNGQPARYVALSYVWGNQSVGGLSVPHTTRSNVMKRIGVRGLDGAWDRLPSTIQDVFRLVRWLGERYLWVDSLCIVQDSVNSWELNAKAMHLVYGHAHFTICAADGDATTGLVAVGSNLRTSGLSPTPTNSGRASPSGPSTAGRHGNNGSPEDRGGPSPAMFSSPAAAAAPEKQARLGQQASLTATVLPGVELLVSRSPESVIQDSVWNQRGWTFQERLLSRRCLVFAEGKVYFQCRTAVMSQDILNDGGDTDTWSLDWANSPLRTLVELRRKAFWFYMKCVGLYTGRRLTKPKDVLTAFQGVSWLLQKRLNAPLLYGLPTSHFDLALLWMPLGYLERRKQKRQHWSRQGLCSQDELGHCNCKLEQEGYGGNEFPSWSWCGWMEGKAGYQLDMLDGCLLNVREWLRDHTWILWYVRDDEGNLRPLWDRNRHPEDGSEEERWRGYRGLAAEAEVGQSQHSSPYGNQGSDGRWSRRTNKDYLQRLPPGYYDEDERGAGEFSTQTGLSMQAGTRVDAPGSGAELPGGGTDSAREPPTYPGSGSGPAMMGIWSPQGPPPPQGPPSNLLGQGGSGGPLSMAANPPGPRQYHQHDRGRDSVASGSEDGIYVTVEDPPENPPPEMYLGSGEDPYGRPVRGDVREGIDFASILPDHPFGVNRGPFRESAPGLADHERSMPILQFFTWLTDLRVRVRHSPAAATTTPGAVAGASGPLPLDPRSSLYDPSPRVQVQCDVFDASGDWCGAIVLPHDWIAQREGQALYFIAISEAKGMTMEECPVWNYYVPKEREESEWDLYYVLPLERDQERALWERKGLGKVFKAAFGQATWDEIKLG